LIKLPYAYDEGVAAAPDNGAAKTSWMGVEGFNEVPPSLIRKVLTNQPQLTT